MKLKFKVQPYQTTAVDSVVNCFAGQPSKDNLSYQIDPGVIKKEEHYRAPSDYEGFRNAELELTGHQVLANIQKVQRLQNLPVSASLEEYFFTDKSNKDGTPRQKPASYKPGASINLDIEMETGTGKTYCYIKSIFEMNKRYGWSKFIIMVPSVAIREGVHKSFAITADHFAQHYGGKKARFFIYNSKRLHEIESFSSDAGINVMIINIQAFNASGKDNRRIYDELDDFQSRRPIEVISKNRPILILDEPQKMEGKATLDALPKFKPLMILRYSATHRTSHCKIHRLDALDAYNEKLVKKIAVRGIQTKGLAGTNAYLYLEGIDISKKAPVARIEIEVRQKNGELRRKLLRLDHRDNLYDRSGGLDQYKDFVISQIDARSDTVEFSNGHVLEAGQASGDVNERDIRRIQIRETIRAHIEKEKRLFQMGIKVLSLFFIDEVAKYRDYSREDTKGDYARVFEEEYDALRDEYLSELPLDNDAYREYLAAIPSDQTHNGYFSVDKKTKNLVDPKIISNGELAGTSDDVDAYDLILKDKETLLAYPLITDDPAMRARKNVRFIFSHSALREGWDNPNVFVMCMLKHSDNTISRRQEVGRGLRISVDQHGDRTDNPVMVHDINVLTVVASESYKNFVKGLQSEIVETLSARPRQATEEFFTGKIIQTRDGEGEVTPAIAKQIYRYLLKNDYTDDADNITEAYHEAKRTGELAALPEDLQPLADEVFKLIDSVFSPGSLSDTVKDDRKTKRLSPNDNLHKKEFLELWQRINHKAVYRVDFDTNELVRKCIAELNSHLRVTPLQYIVQSGAQGELLTDEELKSGAGFKIDETRTEKGKSIHSRVKYDLLGNLSERVQLTRKTVAEIMSGIEASFFAQFSDNPEHFLSEAARLIQEQKGSMVIERLTYDELEGQHDIKEIFTKNQISQDFARATEKLQKHVYDYCITDSDTEKKFVEELDVSADVAVYAKLPRGFLIPTPVGDYNPDWAISFTEGSVRHIYFVAETKGSMSSLQLRKLEQSKIKCARKFFHQISQSVEENRVKYDVVDSYSKLMDVVR
ncbi:MAG: DEAD/DEAH box helicase family protein [Pseudomonadota bacterium]